MRSLNGCKDIWTQNDRRSSTNRSEVKVLASSLALRS
jgi:hypothetical protein